MSFTDQQKLMLAENLDGKLVKEREQAGRKFSYIEGWHAIAEANRIFGFDGWSRETIHAACVWEGPFTTSKGTEMHAASYIAKVRVTVGEVIREGTGSGSGMAVNPGEAHESAIKEAETDAMKRALITFGNPFGLALYDKTQAGVDKPEGSGFRRPAPPPPKPPAPRTPNVERDRHFGNAADEIRSGQNGTPGHAKPSGEPMGPKEWANSIEAHHWIQGEAVTQINAIGNPKSLGEWQSVNRESLEALELHCAKRHAWLMNKVNERLDYLTNLRGAA